MIGTSECRTPGLTRNGEYMLRDVLHSFPLQPAARRAVQAQMDGCSMNAVSPASPQAPSVVVRFARSPGVSGKAGFLGIDPSGLVAARIAPASKSPEELASRLVALPARKMLIA
jgi:hypothetical protein